MTQSLETLRQEFERLCYELGFDDVGIADATGETPSGSHMLSAVEKGLHGPLDYLERTKHERANVRELLPAAQTVIVLVKNYFTGHHASHPQPQNSAKIARYAWGKDYHHWFRKRLRKLRTFLQERAEDPQIHVFNDTGPVLERAWARHAGLGFIGKSGMFIHRRYGTWTFLGGLVTSIPFRCDSPFERDLCGTCQKCLTACPTKAIIAPRTLDARRCLTTWNVERPLANEATNRLFWGDGWGLGCDICQEVCPWNKFETATSEPRFSAQPQHRFLTSKVPEDLRGTALARPGHLGLQNNLRRALATPESDDLGNRPANTGCK